MTCAHVIDGIKSVQASPSPGVVVEMNKLDPAGGKVKVNREANTEWFCHPGWVDRCRLFGPVDKRTYSDQDAAVDVAVSPAYFDEQTAAVTDWWAFPPTSFLPKSELTASTEHQQPLNEGDEVFTIGFPIGFQHDIKNWPAVRQGVIAQIQPYIRGTTPFFLIDASIFGGNSGSPVVTKPQAVNIQGTTKLFENRLVGMVTGNRTDLSGKESVDLGVVIPIDTINATIDMALRTRGG